MAGGHLHTKIHYNQNATDKGVNHSMKLREVIENLATLSGDATIFANRVNGEFCAESEVVLVELSDEELDMQIGDIAKAKAPGKEYFLEIFIIEEVFDGVEFKTLDKKIERIIYYAENDA